MAHCDNDEREKEGLEAQGGGGEWSSVRVLREKAPVARSISSEWPDSVVIGSTRKLSGNRWRWYLSAMLVPILTSVSWHKRMGKKKLLSCCLFESWRIV